jgi:nucleotide-binding universal stress UspA family protein
VRNGKAAQEILETAKAKKVDLIVMGYSDGGGVEAVMGGTSERVARHAPCSVLCIRGQE